MRVAGKIDDASGCEGFSVGEYFVCSLFRNETTLERLHLMLSCVQNKLGFYHQKQMLTCFGPQNKITAEPKYQGQKHIGRCAIFAPGQLKSNERQPQWGLLSTLRRYEMDRDLSKNGLFLFFC